MEISKIVTNENYTAINQILQIAKQDIAIDNCIQALNKLATINNVEFEDEFENFGKKFGLNDKLIDEIRNLKYKLQNAKHGRY